MAVLVASWIGGRIVKGGRIPARLLTKDEDEVRVLLKESRIKDVYYCREKFYIIYDAEHRDYFLMEEDPKGVKTELVKERIEVCPKCKGRLSIKDGKTYCFRCRSYTTPEIAVIVYPWVELEDYLRYLLKELGVEPKEYKGFFDYSDEKVFQEKIGEYFAPLDRRKKKGYKIIEVKIGKNAAVVSVTHGNGLGWRDYVFEV